MIPWVRSRSVCVSPSRTWGFAARWKTTSWPCISFLSCGRSRRSALMKVNVLFWWLCSMKRVSPELRLS